MNPRSVRGSSVARIFALLTLGLFILSSLSPPFIAQAGPGMDPAVLDRELETILTITPAHERLGVIVQFDDRITSADEARLGALGFDIRYRYHALPAIWARGTVDAVRELSLYERTFFIENNTRIQGDMDLSTKVINATLAWTNQVTDRLGDDRFIDGSGVTAVVVDTGIDAGHPDMDYHEKTIMNLYLETEDMSWKEAENTDLYYGHGTHVAGTVAGNGDASAGSRRGVAPGANLIGVTIWDPTMAEYLVGEEWVYDHSRPNNNPYNIRVATNSWHTIEDEYENESALSQIIMKLAHENNVVTTWSAGNEGRTDPEGTTVTTSIEGNTPVAVMVAAYERDGSAVTDFSSRGEIGKPQTYPDIGAPGRSIWSTSARRTVISGGTYAGGNRNPYYLAISGTSMSTPHVCGLVTLLFQAAPSLTISDRHEDFNGTPEETEEWMANPYTRIHEVEWIMEVTSTYLPPSDETGVFAQDNATGADGQPIDYAQGYGIVNVQDAVGVALTLQRLRDQNPRREITVDDALRTYYGKEVLVRNQTGMATDVLYTNWEGEYSRYNNQYGIGLSDVNQTKMVWVPETASTVSVKMDYSPVNQETASVGDITYTIDFNGDGTVDHTGPLFGGLTGQKEEEIPVQQGGGFWTFDVTGQGFRLHLPRPNVNYVELRIEYRMGVQVVMDTDPAQVTDATGYNATAAIMAPLMFGTPTSSFSGGTLEKDTGYYDMSRVELVIEKRPDREEEPGISWTWYVLLFLVATFISYLYHKRRRGSSPVRASTTK